MPIPLWLGAAAAASAVGAAGAAGFSVVKSVVKKEEIDWEDVGASAVAGATVGLGLLGVKKDLNKNNGEGSSGHTKKLMK